MPAGAYHLRDFHKTCRVCTSFQHAFCVKISLDLLKGLWSHGGFKLRGSVYPQIFSAPAKLCVRPPKVLELRERARGPLSPCQVLWCSDFTRLRGRQKRWGFLFVCLSVCSSRFWTLEIVRPISPWRCWSTETILIPLDSRRFVVAHSCSTFSDYCQLATPLNAKVQKTVKIGIFRHYRTQNKPIETKVRM